MKKIPVSAIFLVIFAITAAKSTAEEEYYGYLINAQSLIGATGNLITPSPYTVPDGTLTFGIHRFILGLGYGCNKNWEMGLSFNLRQVSSIEEQSTPLVQTEGEQRTIFHAKYSFTRNKLDKKAVNIASGIYFMNFANQYSFTGTYYVVGSAQLSSWVNTLFQFGTDLSDNKLAYFFTFLYPPTKYSLFILEYKTRTGEGSFGWRVLLAPDVKFDIFLKSTGTIKDWFSTLVFGLTLATN